MFDLMRRIEFYAELIVFLITMHHDIALSIGAENSEKTIQDRVPLPVNRVTDHGKKSVQDE